MNKEWKNEAINIDVEDIIRYNQGYLAIMKFSAKGTQWYAPIPVYRSKIEANLAGQRMLQKM